MQYFSGSESKFFFGRGGFSSKDSATFEKNLQKTCLSFESKDIASTSLFMVFYDDFLSFRIEKSETLLAKIFQIDGISSSNSII